MDHAVEAFILAVKVFRLAVGEQTVTEMTVSHELYDACLEKMKKEPNVYDVSKGVTVCGIRLMRSPTS